MDWVADIRLDAALALGEKQPKACWPLLLPAASKEGMDDPYGTEIDAEIHGKWFAKSKIVLGAATFIPNGDRYNDGKPAYSFYFMPIVNF